MKKNGYSRKQIVKTLQKAEKAIQAGYSLSEVCNNLGISTTTYYRWRRDYGKLSISEIEKGFPNIQLEQIVDYFPRLKVADYP